MRLPWLLEFLYAGMNFHAEHHLAPIIPFYRLRDFHESLVSRGLLKSENFSQFLRNDFYKFVMEQRTG